ncbi:GtrA family protein [Burkholderia multivorans]|uniref:GtrA family protein n=1 Tax=Burkholderia multivorans TaxID=87883 RepID=UPI000CFEB8D9|nr:GtrA family protein [Burkholderia multivorans]MBU9212255.1 GtrA family protein [Burkholderia multivorans]MCL4628947.1 GtrA family protein [Burkholderia multivorans]PRG96080.1 GtrA family protein [Burkholderia multivorans]HEF4780137.1 GtrA family protein [Burkholderia multivorans]HEF4827433.1 GtrA family protein [Burkholderia multivorans]
MIRRELAIFLVVGTLTVLVDFLGYRGLVRLGLFDVDIAKGISFVLGTAFAYFANRLWTFGHTAHAPGTAWRFIVVYACTLTANVVVNAAMLRVIDSFAVQLAFLIATGISASLNFIGMKWFVFRAQSVSELK